MQYYSECSIHAAHLKMQFWKTVVIIESPLHSSKDMYVHLTGLFDFFLQTAAPHAI